MTEQSGPAATAEAAAEFRRRFWLAREHEIRAGQAARAEDAEQRAAMEFAKSQGWGWAEGLLEASRLDCAGAPEKALELLAQSQPAVPAPWRALFHFLRGSALAGKEDPDGAIQAFREALADPKFDRPGETWNSLGIAFFSKGDYDEAIKAYQQALAVPGYETPGKAWNNLGIALSVKGRHEEAITALSKALADPKFDMAGGAWNNLGRALAAKGEPERAIGCFRKALESPEYDTPAKAWTNLGETYLKAGQPEKAQEAFEQALASPDAKGGDHARARLQLQVLKAKITPAALSPDDRAVVGSTPPPAQSSELEGEIIAAIQQAGETQYEKYLAEKDSGRDNTLSILRGWSSAVTLLEGSERRWRGGGYFLKWRGCGMVIDPGFDFLRNFHDAGYHGREVHAMVVSHNHPDHNSNLKDIDDLRYELFKRLTANQPGSQPYVLLWDEDTNGGTKFAFEAPKHHYDPIVMACGFPQAIDLRTHRARLPVRITPFKVKHGSDVPHAMGMLLELFDGSDKPAVRIGYTGDTAYFPELQTHLSNCDLLIAHISQPSIEELQDASKLKSVHLGYRGTIQLLKECQPRLVLIGEFWAGFADLRIPLVKALRQRSGVDAVLPAGLALHVALPSLEVECTKCDGRTALSRIKVAPPVDSFKNLAYLCPRCVIG